jgi:hypothetical protein
MVSQSRSQVTQRQGSRELPAGFTMQASVEPWSCLNRGSGFTTSDGKPVSKARAWSNDLTFISELVGSPFAE